MTGSPQYPHRSRVATVIGEEPVVVGGTAEAHWTGWDVYHETDLDLWIAGPLDRITITALDGLGFSREARTWSRRGSSATRPATSAQPRLTSAGPPQRGADWQPGTTARVLFSTWQLAAYRRATSDGSAVLKVSLTKFPVPPFELAARTTPLEPAAVVLNVEPITSRTPPPLSSPSASAGDRHVDAETVRIDRPADALLAKRAIP